MVIEVTEMFPASAGMNRKFLTNTKEVDNVPRERGDEPKMDNDARQQAICSPRARG